MTPTECHLTEHERAYRRGCLHAVQYLLEDLHGLIGPPAVQLLVAYQRELVAGRDSADPVYLGHYLDIVRRKTR